MAWCIEALTGLGGYWFNWCAGCSDARTRWQWWWWWWWCARRRPKTTRAVTCGSRGRGTKGQGHGIALRHVRLFSASVSFAKTKADVHVSTPVSLWSGRTTSTEGICCYSIVGTTHAVASSMADGQSSMFPKPAKLHANCCCTGLRTQTMKIDPSRPRHQAI